MNETIYKPLTPEMRLKINESLDNNIAELKTCERNAIVNYQIFEQENLKKLINALPDGFLMPLERR